MNPDLTTLIKGWRDDAKTCTPKGDYEMTLKACADELEHCLNTGNVARSPKEVKKVVRSNDERPVVSWSQQIGFCRNGKPISEADVKALLEGCGPVWTQNALKEMARRILS